MLAVRLDGEVERREALANRTGRTRTFYAREAIEASLDDPEHFYLAEERLRRFRDRDAVSSTKVLDDSTGSTEARGKRSAACGRRAKRAARRWTAISIPLTPGGADGNG